MLEVLSIAIPHDVPNGREYGTPHGNFPMHYSGNVGFWAIGSASNHGLIGHLEIVNDYSGSNRKMGDVVTAKMNV